MKNLFKIIRNSYVRLGIAGLLLLVSLFFFFSNVRFSEEFTGGVSIVVDNTISENTMTELSSMLKSQGYEDSKVLIQSDGTQATIRIHTLVKDDVKVALLSESIKNFLLEKQIIQGEENILSQAVTGPSIGSYMKRSAITALVAGLIFIVIYMLFSFAGIRYYISPTTLAIVTIITMVFDIAIPAGAYGIWMSINSTVQVDTIFIIAILTCMGYSINDTIVILDRVRENFKKKKNEKNIIYGEVFEKSLWQTMRRSIATSISTLLVVVAMFIFGTGIIKSFAFVVGMGIIAGSYSSIFIAVPLTYLTLNKLKKEKQRL